MSPALVLVLVGCAGADPLSSAGALDAGRAPDDAAAAANADAIAPEPADAALALDAGLEDAQAPDAAAPDARPLADATPRGPPPELPHFSGTACPRLVSGPTSTSSLNRGFLTGGFEREFRVLVPRSYDPSREWPVMFAWHWLNASSNSFVRDGELESAVEEMGFIAVLPDKRISADGRKSYQFDWPFIETNTGNTEAELVFFDDMLACVGEQFRVDRSRIYAIGVSAGALWVTYLSTTERARHFAAMESLSGGLGEIPNVWQMQYQPQPNKFPAIVLWGGSSDWLVLNFERASMNYRDALRADGHFVVECIHNAGHAIPPIMAPPGSNTRFYSLWRFMLDHPYGIEAGESPYLTSGLPAGFPPWCRILLP